MRIHVGMMAESEFDGAARGGECSTVPGDRRFQPLFQSTFVFFALHRRRGSLQSNNHRARACGADTRARLGVEFGPRSSPRRLDLTR